MRRIALDSSGLTIQGVEAMERSLGDVEVVEGLGLLREMRMVKTPVEVEMLRRATEVLEKAMEDALEIISSGVSEVEASGMFRYSLASDGGVETLTLLGFGERSSYPNPIPSTLEAARGDVIRLRLGCTLSHYHSRVSRTAILGRPRKELRGVWETILSAQDAALEALEPGASASDVYGRAERALREGGLRGLGLSIGSGIGLEAYEPPRIGRGRAPGGDGDIHRCQIPQIRLLRRRVGGHLSHHRGWS